MPVLLSDCTYGFHVNPALNTEDVLRHLTDRLDPRTPAAPPAQYDDVALAGARWLAENKRAKLIEVAMTEPDPEIAGAAAAELRRMIATGQ
ncbi:hypothetical protein [Nocardia cyriacigeorgica]|uniref:Uncharacterized protein n=1 Tax=Nocardia cyriacigeorgica TaxID=135487 RepID=A0A5R8NEE4_9NOCA|nr:hypothetical protein [Nocardia cyriacigeorgica]TLF72907.1 hypothetical protein FEK34_28195 [Nocardia cyriacigeorgica]